MMGFGALDILKSNLSLSHFSALSLSSGLETAPTRKTKPIVFKSPFLLLSNMAANGWPGGADQAAQAPPTQEGEDAGGGASDISLPKAAGTEPGVAYSASAPLQVSCEIRKLASMKCVPNTPFLRLGPRMTR